MPQTDAGRDDAPAAPQHGRFARPSLELRVRIAELAYKFFGLVQTRQWADLANAPHTEGHVHPRDVGQFVTFLKNSGVPLISLGDLTRLLDAMRRAGLLLDGGFDRDRHMSGQIYMANGRPTSQRPHNATLWLAEVFGAEMIIPLYSAVTVLIVDQDAEADGTPSWGTGLVLDRSHVLTNRHVVQRAPRHLGIVGQSGSHNHVKHRFDAHDTIDVAVIELEFADGNHGLQPLPGMVFRDPAWADETYVFGYPRVPMTAEMALTVQGGEVVDLPAMYAVQRGEIVNPSIPTTTPDREPVFLYSAIARPGNSGGPVVAADGRVIGLVVEDSADTLSSDGGPASAPFYRGIASGRIFRALSDLNLPHLARWETWD